MDYFDEEGPDEKEGKEKESEGSEEESEKSEPSAPGGKGAPDEQCQNVIDLLEQLDVHIDGEKVHTAKDLLAQLEPALHALVNAEKADEAGSAGGAAGNSLQEETPANSGVAMSVNKGTEKTAAASGVSQADFEALKAKLSLADQRIAHAEDMASKDRLRLILADVDKMLDNGRCTKADADEWREKLTKARLSLVSMKPSADVVEVFAAIKQAKKVPEGTFLDGEAKAKKDAEATSRLSLNPVGNNTPWHSSNEEITPERMAAVINEFHKNTGLNGLAK